MNEGTMTGDYARVLHKLSEVLKRHPSTEVESTEKAAEALRIRIGRALSSQSNISSDESWSLCASIGTSDDGQQTPLGDSYERPYDELVYILWR